MGANDGVQNWRQRMHCQPLTHGRDAVFPFPQKQPVLCSPFCFLQSQIERAKVQAFVVRADVLRPLVRRLIARRKLYRMAAAWMVRSGDVCNGWNCWRDVVREVGWNDG